MKQNVSKKKLALAGVMTAAVLMSALPMSTFAAEYGTPGYLVAAAASAASATVPTSSTTFTFTDSGVVAQGEQSGYKIEGTSLTINAAGTYTITGSCAEGSVKVKKGTTGVTLVLQDLTLTSTTTAPLSINKGSQATVYVAGTVTLNDNEDASTEDTNEDFEGAAIKVKSESASLTIEGTGTLNLNGNAKNGIKGAATAGVTIAGATVNVTAANNGVAADGSVSVTGGKLNIKAGNDGIKAEPDEDDTDSLGTVTITGGEVTINSTGDGIQSTGDLTITGGTFDITTFGGYKYASKLGDESAKGIKSDTKVSITGGTFTINSADDAIHANDTVYVGGGTFTIFAGDDAVHGDAKLTIDSGNFTVKSCYEGFEAGVITLNGGSASIEASDDGINAATDLVTNEIAIYINGGTWYINANGDGLDAGGDSRNNSGGNIVVSGGTTVVFGAANNGNAALDFDGKCTHTGGTLLAVGMSGMVQAPSSGSYVVFGSAGMGGGMGGFGGQMGGMGQTAGGVNVTAGATLSIKDSSGNELISTTAVKSANSIVFAGDALTSGETYTLYVNGSAVATATVGEAVGNRAGGTIAGRGEAAALPTDGFDRENATQPTTPSQGQQGGQNQGTAPTQGQQPVQNQGTAPTQGQQPGMNQGAAPGQGQQPGMNQGRQSGMGRQFGGGRIGGRMNGQMGRGGCATAPSQEQAPVQDQQTPPQLPGEDMTPPEVPAQNEAPALPQLPTQSEQPAAPQVPVQNDQPADQGFGDMMLDAFRANRDLGIGGMTGPAMGEADRNRAGGTIPGRGEAAMLPTGGLDGENDARFGFQPDGFGGQPGGMNNGPMGGQMGGMNNGPMGGQMGGMNNGPMGGGFHF